VGRGKAIQTGAGLEPLEARPRDGVPGNGAARPESPASSATPSAGRRNLRICWVLPGTGLSGGVKSTRLLAEAMVARGHDVTIAYPKAGPPWPSPLHVGSFARRAMKAWKALGDRDQLPHHLESSTARLIPVNEREVLPRHVPDADILIGTWWETMEWLRGWPASKGMLAHFIRHYEIFGGDPERVHAVYKMRTMKFVIARWLQRLMAEEYGQTSAVLVPNGVDWAQFSAEPRDKAPVPTVGLQYSHVRWKDTPTAFEAIRIAQKSVPELRVLAFGNKPLLPEHAPPNNLEFFLRPPQDQIPQIYRQADCWIVSSVSEGFGMPGLESAACRCPVISTRCGGPEDYIENGVSGHLVDVGDAERMARRIVEVVSLDNDRWRRMSDASHAISRKFNWESSAEILEAALIAALDAAPASAQEPVAVTPAR
jgi:glycosyltransferase involved in cell wall biosynthesis